MQNAKRSVLHECLTLPHLHSASLTLLQKEDKDSTDLGYMTSEKAYRIVLAGDAAVGKSSFLLRLCKNEFKLNSSATLGESDKLSQLSLTLVSTTVSFIILFTPL